MTPPILSACELAGPKVLLRPITIADAAASYPLVHERPAVTDWLRWDGPESLEELVRRYESWVRVLAHGARYQLAVVERASGDYCGTLDLLFGGEAAGEDVGEGVIGYWLGERYWSVGLGTEAVALVARLSFAHLGARRLTAHVYEGNIASERVLVKNGFREEPGARDVVPKGDGHRSRRCFRLAHADWAALADRSLVTLEHVRLR